MQNYVYDANFSGNILIVRSTGCRKTYFTQKLAINRFFGQLKKVEWVLYIELKLETEAEKILFFVRCGISLSKRIRKIWRSFRRF